MNVQRKILVPTVALLIFPFCLLSSADESQTGSLKQTLELLEDGYKGKIDDPGFKECGISCLYLLLKLNGVKVEYSRLVDEIPIGEKGASLFDLAETGKKLGLNVSAVRCSPTQLESMSLPVIAHLESTGGENSATHYVLITGVRKKTLTLFDPFDNEIKTARRSEVGALLSGHFLAPTSAPIWSTISLTLGVSIVVLGLLQLAKSWIQRRHGTIQTKSHLIQSSTLFLLGVAAAGCVGEKSLVQTSHPSSRASKKLPIDVTTNELDLGQIEWDGAATGEFTFQNPGNEPVELKLGAPSCKCLNSVLEPDETLGPQQTGRLSLQINTSDRQTAGPIGATIVLYVGKEETPVRFSVKGFLAGVVFPRTDYVIRPDDRRDEKLPLLEFKIVSKKDEDFQLKRVTCVKFEHLRFLATDVSNPAIRYDTNKELPDKTEVEADLAGAVVSSRFHDPGSGMYSQDISIPIRLGPKTKAMSGLIIVDYELDGQSFQGTINLLVLDK